jgi:hypothetical protein
LSTGKFSYVDVMPEVLPREAACAICREGFEADDEVIAAIELAPPAEAEKMLFHRDCL